MHGRVLAVAVLVAATACGGAATTTAVTTASTAEPAAAPGDRCRGSDLTLDFALQHCRIEAGATAAPVPTAAELIASIEPVRLASGATTQVWITLRNATSRPLVVTLPWPVELDASIWQSNERRDGGASYRAHDHCGFTDRRWVRVTLDPGGALRAQVDVAARVTAPRPEIATVPVEDEDVVPIAPGDYTLRVVLSLAGPHPDGTGAREAHAPMTITP